jgi:hypothetical protein
MCGITDGDGEALGNVSDACVMCGITDGEGAGVGDGVSAGCAVCGVADGDEAGFGGGLCPSCCAVVSAAPHKIIIIETTIVFRLVLTIDKCSLVGAPKNSALPTPC